MGSDPQHIAYPGAEGSYTEEAAGRLYPSARQSAFTTFELVAAALVADEVDRGVLPIENSLAGLVPDTLAILEEGAVSVVAEVALHIPHCLVGIQGATLETRARRALPPDGARAVPQRAQRPLRAGGGVDDVGGRAHGGGARRRPRSPRSPARSRRGRTASRSSRTRSPTIPRTSRASSRWRASRGSITTPTRNGTPRSA